ncbi:MAG: hypothetical protein LBP64_04295 [Tannerella sp.]|jgi:hypothetical protein|nr:hypothetical protein [Tannerella sp.]
MSNTDYLPTTFAGLLKWLMNFIGYLSQKEVYVRLGLDEMRIVTLGAEIAVYGDAYTTAEGPNAGKADRLDRKEKAVSVSKSIRRYVNMSLRYNEHVTDEDRVMLGLTVPEARKRSEGEMDEYPEIEVYTGIIRRIKCRFLNREHRVAKPPHVHGVELRSGFIPDGEKPSLTLLPNSSFSTRSTLTMDFSDEERGKRFGLCARYENNKGGKGPFGPIVTVFIP